MHGVFEGHIGTLFLGKELGYCISFGGVEFGLCDAQVDSFDIDDKLGLLPLKAIVAEFEAAILHRALLKYNGNVTAVATQLKIGKTALYDKMKQHGLSAKHIKNTD